jgi:hypothetical protein
MRELKELAPVAKAELVEQSTLEEQSTLVVGLRMALGQGVEVQP